MGYGEPIYDKVIQKESDYDRDKLSELTNMINKNIKVVYIYSLEEEEINYPKKNGNIIYIGEAYREAEPTGKRFTQHISTAYDKGGDNGSNYTISMYYWNGKKLRLKIYKLSNNDNTKDKEKELIKCHVKEYGATPIGQGATGANYTIDNLSTNNFVDELPLIKK